MSTQGILFWLLFISKGRRSRRYHYFTDGFDDFVRVLFKKNEFIHDIYWLFKDANMDQKLKPDSE